MACKDIVKNWGLAYNKTRKREAKRNGVRNADDINPLSQRSKSGMLKMKKH